MQWVLVKSMDVVWSGTAERHRGCGRNAAHGSNAEQMWQWRVGEAEPVQHHIGWELQPKREPELDTPPEATLSFFFPFFFSHSQWRRKKTNKKKTPLLNSINGDKWRRTRQPGSCVRHPAPPDHQRVAQSITDSWFQILVHAAHL